MFLYLRPILFLKIFNSLICVDSLIEKFYIQTVPGTKHHRFFVCLTFHLHLSFFRHNKRLRRGEHLQRKETLSCEPYFSNITTVFLEGKNEQENCQSFQYGFSCLISLTNALTKRILDQNEGFRICLLNSTANSAQVWLDWLCYLAGKS